MPIAWFMCPYRRRDPALRPKSRYPAVFDFDALIRADGGARMCTEVLGSFALVKVQASAATIATVNSDPEFLLLLQDTPLDTVMNLTQQQYNVVNTRLKTQGYSQAEIDAALGASRADWNTHTYRDLLNFAASRRLKPRYIAETDTIVCDGIPQPVTPVSVVDAKVT